MNDVLKDAKERADTLHRRAVISFDANLYDRAVALALMSVAEEIRCLRHLGEGALKHLRASGL